MTDTRETLLSKLTLRELITPARWAAFTDWLEEGEDDGNCAHDQCDYEDWFREHGDPDPHVRANRVWDALGKISPGSCRCNAGSGLWKGTELDNLKAPIIYARPLDLPRLLTGWPEEPSAAQRELGSRFYAVHRGELGAFWEEVPEPAFDGDVDEGMAFAWLMASLAEYNEETHPLAHGAHGRLVFFFHTGDYSTVETWLRNAGHELVSFDKVLEDLAVYVVQGPDGSSATNVRIMVGDAPQPSPAGRLPHLVVMSPTKQTVWVNKSWQPAGGAFVLTDQGRAPLPVPTAGVHALRTSSDE